LPQPPPPPTPFELLLEGKRFTCTECGKCCTGSGEIWANEAECAAIAAHLRLPMLHFFRRYTKSYSRRPGWRMLKLQPGSDHCIFLEGGTKCSIYPVRPLQCSTYPWWPELMDPGEQAGVGSVLLVVVAWVRLPFGLLPCCACMLVTNCRGGPRP
jgi:Fe-S-cluster containining protein